MAIIAGRIWLSASPGAATATDRVAGTTYYDGARLEGAGKDSILVAIREPDNPHDANAIAWWSELAQVGHVPAETAAMLAPRMDDGLALWARVFKRTKVNNRAVVLVEYFGPAMEAEDDEDGSVDETGSDDADELPF